jgi:hypothetical protein
MQFLPTRLPIIVLQRVENFLLAKSWWVLCACMQTKEFCHLIPGICVAHKTKCFLGIIWYLTFSVVSAFKDDFLYL